MDLTPADSAAKIAELKRELAFRERAYRKWVASGRLPRDRANRQMFVLKCILHDYTGDELTRLSVVNWTCPICQHRNHAVAGQVLVHCQRDDVNPDRCGSGPFVVLQHRGNRALGAKVTHEVHRIDGVSYAAAQARLDL